MFAARYWSSRFFTARYWAAAGGDPVPIVPVLGGVGQVWPGLGFPQPGNSPVGGFF